MHYAIDVSENGSPQVYLLHYASSIGDPHPIADPILIFQKDENPGDNVLNQALGAKANGDASDTQASNKGCNIYPHLSEDHEDDSHQDKHRARSHKNAGHGSCPLLHLLLILFLHPPFQSISHSQAVPHSRWNQHPHYIV